jgi:hypothetical protein
MDSKPSRPRGLGLPRALQGNRKERERIEQARQRLRAEEVLPEADACPSCLEARATHGDPTFLCQDHLTRLTGI